MKKFYYFLVVALYIFVAGCAIGTLVTDIYNVFKVAALVSVAIATPYMMTCFDKLVPGKGEDENAESNREG